MEYAISGKSAAALKTDCLILPLDENTTLLPSDLPEETAALVHYLIKDGDFKGKRNQTLLIHAPTGLQAKRLLLVGIGELPLAPVAFLKLVATAMQAARSTGSKSAALQ